MSQHPSAEVIPNVNEIVTNREQFYIPGSLDTHPIFCFDERAAAEAETRQGSGLVAVTPEEYVRMAGGMLGITYNTIVIDEARRPGSVREDFEARTETMTPVLISAGIKPGVHSDTTAESGNVIRPDLAGDVGCGYAGSRLLISQNTGNHGTMLITSASLLRPDLFTSTENYNFAHGVTGAHGRLAQRQDFLPNGGRGVVMTAATSGANIMLMEGVHTGTKGAINLVPNTIFDSRKAIRANEETYNQDSWAFEEVFDRIRNHYPHDKREQQIAETLDALGTMLTLGVKEVSTRRPGGRNTVVSLVA